MSQVLAVRTETGAVVLQALLPRASAEELSELLRPTAGMLSPEAQSPELRELARQLDRELYA